MTAALSPRSQAFSSSSGSLRRFADRVADATARWAPRAITVNTAIAMTSSLTGTSPLGDAYRPPRTAAGFSG